MIEWWYVPGVSTRSRRSSGCDGFASSSSWKTVRIPNRLPRTANEPTAATAAPAAAARAAPHSWRTPVRSRAPRSEKTEMTSAPTTAIGDAGLDEQVQPVAAADGDDAGEAAEQDVRRELERGAVDRPGDDRQDAR